MYTNILIFDILFRTQQFNSGGQEIDRTQPNLPNQNASQPQFTCPTVNYVQLPQQSSANSTAVITPNILPSPSHTQQGQNTHINDIDDPPPSYESLFMSAS